MAGQTAWYARTAGVALVLLGAGCAGGGEEPGTIDDVREVDQPSPGLAPVDSAERFGFAGGGHGPGDGHGHADPHADPHAAPSAGSGGIDFTWDLPEGWEELPPSSMRQANFRVAGSPDAECYLTLLPGGAGGVAANVNRWRSQLGLEPLEPAEVDALPHGDLVGGDALFVDMTGDYRGMGSEAQPDYRLAGLILEAPSATLFLKMVGPAAVIDREIEHFKELGASFGVRQPEPSASADASRPPASSSPNSAQGLSWETPEGWVRGDERSMRLVTFTPEGAPDAECYVTVLPGEAGGVAANLNRWRSQMGQPELTQAEIEALDRRDVLGSESPFIEIEGDFTGMSGTRTADAGFLGLICTVGTGTLFVKMTGPADVIEAERENFLAFCESLSLEGS